jgi:hypothetical protein
MTISVAVISLLALTSAAATAQSEGCTGILELGGESGSEGMTWQATDERLSGDATASGGWSLYGTPSEDAGDPTAGGEVASYIIVNEDGTWECADASASAPEPDSNSHTLVFAGNGDYQGLTAHVRIDWSEYPFSFSGVILEGGLPTDPTLAG